MLDTKQIMQIIPHRPPMLLVDRIIELEPGKRAVGLKAVTVNEPFFAGHFPGNPIMPGVLQVEAAAQVGAVCMLVLVENQGKVPMFAGLNDVRFRRPVVPGDLLRLEVEIMKTRGPVGFAACKGLVDGKLCFEGEAMFALGAPPPAGG